jgi:hypothetical protein
MAFKKIPARQWRHSGHLRNKDKDYPHIPGEEQAAQQQKEATDIHRISHKHV